MAASFSSKPTSPARMAMLCSVARSALRAERALLMVGVPEEDGEISRCADGVFGCCEVAGVGVVGAVQPCGLHSGAGGAVDIPGVGSHQNHLVRLYPACVGCIIVGGPNRFPGRSVLNGQKSLELAPDSGLGQQSLGHLR